MPMTEARKRANDKWDRANRTMMGVKVYRDKAEAFKLACYENGTTPNAIFTDAISGFIDQHGGWDYWLQQVHSSPAEDLSSST